MPAVPITSREQYVKAIKVLDEVGGTWQSVGFDEWFLLVGERQYKALVEAGVVTVSDPKKEQKRGKKTPKNGNL